MFISDPSRNTPKPKPHGRWLVLTLATTLLGLLFGLWQGQHMSHPRLHTLSSQLGYWELVLFLMFSNLKVALYALLFSLLNPLLGLWYVFENARLALGLPAGQALNLGQWPIFNSRILPHAIWELCALSLASTAGFQLGWHTFVRELSAQEAASKALRLLGFSLLLWFIAALIEAQMLVTTL